MKPIHEQDVKARFNGGNPCLTSEGNGIVAYVPKAEWLALFSSAPDMARALLPLARFIEALDANPLRGVDDAIYSIHGGRSAPSGKGEEIRISELRDAVSALRKAGVLP